MFNLYLNSLYTMLVSENPIKQAYAAYVGHLISIKSGGSRMVMVNQDIQKLHEQRNVLHRMADNLPEKPSRLDVSR